jgi:hypothetical protein
MDADELQTVYTVANSVQAEIIKNYLESEGIRCFVEGENQAAEAGLMALEIKIQVSAADFDRARQLLELHDAHKRHSQPPPAGED